MASELSISCVHPGIGAWLVDGGRPGHRSLGIAGGGAADPTAQRTANRLLGQAPRSCCLEVYLHGGVWLLSGSGQIALGGADMNWRLNGQPVDRYSVLYLEGDYLLAGRAAVAGCRAYLGVRGEWQLPRRLGSVEAGLPGVSTVSAGFCVTVRAATETAFANELVPAYQHGDTPLQLRVQPGPEWSWLSTDDQRQLLRQPLQTGRLGDRQGLRLCSTWAIPTLPAMISAPVLPGTVQLTPSGLILLGPDAQTTGGYPRVLLVEKYQQAYQLRPGQWLSFTP